MKKAALLIVLFCISGISFAQWPSWLRNEPKELPVPPQELPATMSLGSKSIEISKDILAKSQELHELTINPMPDFLAIEHVLAELEFSIARYKSALEDDKQNFMLNELLSKSPYPGEMLLGTTSAGNDSWLEVVCKSPINVLITEIRFRKTRGGSEYIRIYEAEVTYPAPDGMKTELIKIDEKRLYSYAGDYRQLRLPRPMKAIKIRLRIAHRTNGVEVWGMPVIVKMDFSDRPDFGRSDQEKMSPGRFENERIYRERMEEERFEKLRLDRERFEKEKAQKVLLEREKLEKEKAEKEKAGKKGGKQ
jgi:hypothetical protein